MDCLAGCGQVCGASVSYQIPFTCSPHSTLQLATGSQARAEIPLGPHGHFAGGDLTDTPAPHQDAEGGLLGGATIFVSEDESICLNLSLKDSKTI